MDAELTLGMLQTLERLLGEDLEDSAQWPVLLRRLDCEALSAQASRRAGRAGHILALQERLAAALAAPRTPEIDATLAQVRALAARLCDADARHQAMARLGLGTLRGYVGSLNPGAGAYTRAGQLAAGRARSALSRHV